MLDAQFVSSLRRDPGGKLGRAHEVGEQHGDGLHRSHGTMIAITVATCKARPPEGMPWPLAQRPVL
jgi:hypothetical protein